MGDREQEAMAGAVPDELNGAGGGDDLVALGVDTTETSSLSDEAVSDEAVPGEAVSGEAPPADDGIALDDFDDDTALMLDLANAMHTAAAARHTRAIEAVERLSTSHVQKIRERAETEAASAQAHAERDVAEIVDWAAAEVARIQAEKVRRGEARERELDALLDRHQAQIAWEIEAVEDAVQAHRVNLDAFYARLTTELDAATIARLAQDPPQLPDLEGISANARARSIAGGVMPDGPAARTDGVSQWGSPSSADAPDPSAASSTADEEEAEAPAFEREADVVGVMAPEAAVPRTEAEDSDLIGVPEEPARAQASGARGTGTLLQAISVLRPTTSWWNRGPNDTPD